MCSSLELNNEKYVYLFTEICNTNMNYYDKFEKHIFFLIEIFVYMKYNIIGLLYQVGLLQKNLF